MTATYKSYSYFFLMSFNICWGTFLMGYFLIVYNPLQQEIEHQYNWNDESSKNLFEGLITAVIPLGAAIGSFFSSYSFKFLGRKKSCYFMDFLCIVGSGLTLVQSLSCLMIGRLLCGMTVGVNSILVGLYIREICPLELSDVFGSFGNFALNVGITVSFCLGLNTLSEQQLDDGQTDNWWRVMFGLPIIIAAIRSLFILMFFNYDSPIDLLWNNENDKAMDIIKALYKSEHVQHIYETLSLRVDSLKKRKQPQFLREILDRRYSLRLFIGLSLVFANQFSGVNAIAFYSKKLFLKLGWSDSVANGLNLGLGLVNILAGIVIAIPIKKLGVKYTYLISLFLVVIMLGLIALFTLMDINLPSVIFTVGYNFSYNLGCGPIIFMIIPQILPERLIGFVFIMNWVFAFVIGFMFPKMIDSNSLGVDGSFLFFACCVLAVFVFNMIFLKETGGKTNAEISSVYAKLNDYKEPFDDIALEDKN